MVLQELRPLPGRSRPLARLRRPLLITATLVVITGAAALAALNLRPAGAPALPIAGAPSPPAVTRAALDYDNGVFTGDAGRWAVGAPGDAVALGDWDCDGTDTLVLLRPSTGAVYAFLTWATETADARADALGVVEGATRLETTDIDADGCDDLRVHRTTGEPVTMHPPDHL